LQRFPLNAAAKDGADSQSNPIATGPLLNRAVYIHPMYDAAAATPRASDLLRFIYSLVYKPNMVRLPAGMADR
jgi:hypothetical protein